jgi:5-(carboxyamino)imidazole ribonucleotide synthase
MTSRSHFPTVGILGAGQMARMLIEAATRLNIEIKLLSKSSEESAALIANNVIVGDISNHSDLSVFALDTDVITFDLNEFPYENLKRLEKEGQVFRPQISAIEHLENSDFVKKTLIEANLPFQDKVDNFERLLSVQAARSEHGQTVVYPVVQCKK